MNTTFGEYLAGPFVMDDELAHAPGAYRPMYIKLHPCYGEFRIEKQNRKFNAINICGEPFFVEDNEKIIPVSNVDAEYYDEVE